MGLFDFLRKKPRKPAYATAVGGRYEGRPLLILLENYVLRTIDCLPPDKEALAASITRRIFGEGPDWRATLRSTLRLDESLDENLRQMWKATEGQAQVTGASPSPESFAREVADHNFAHLIEPTLL